METRVVDRIDRWEQVSFDGGYRGLAELENAGFSGVVRAGDAELYMVRGTAIGIRNGEIEDFEEEEGRAYKAPSPALPLLGLMQETNDEVRDKFYTEETPLSTVDETLSEGGFTGYVKLSENVLSGAYYLVYHGGRSMSVAFIGQSERLQTDAKAREAAMDEIGIYEVRPASVQRIKIPTPAPVPTEPTKTASNDTHADEQPGEDTADEQPGDEQPGEDTADEQAGKHMEHAGVDRQAQTGAETQDEAASENEQPVQRETEEDGESETAVAVNPTDSATQRPSHAEVGEPLGDREVPSLDPARTQTGPSESAVSVEPTPSVTDEDDDADGVAPEMDGDAHSENRENGNGDEREEIESLRAERDRLREQVSRFQAGKETATATETASTGRGHPSQGRDISPAQARDATVVFVRYRSPSAGTLKDAHAGEITRDTLRDNRQLEIYDGFEETVTVDGTPYKEFVTETLGYRFLDWLTGDLLFEIRETGNQKALAGLYDAIPRIDRVEFDGTVSAEESVTFDLVARDRREQPLVVANLDSQKGAVSTLKTEQLAAAVETASTAHPTITAAFLVTEQFFDVGALDAVDEATKSGLLSRESKKSFVNLSRNAGYHLCLVEAREDIPHLIVPEL